jgi:lysozyme
MLLLANDIEQAEADASRVFMNFEDLSDARKQALTNLAFNLGYGRLCGFRKMIRAVEHEEWEQAARELLDSKYAKQVKGRSVELAEMLRKG